MVKTPSSQCKGCEFNAPVGELISHILTTQSGQKKKKKLKMVNFMLHVLCHTHKINIPKCASKEMEFFN